jgi:hypothetical protein
MENGRGEIAHDGDVWFAEPCEEIALASDRYDFTISLLHLDRPLAWERFGDVEEVEDSFDVFNQRTSSSLLS